MPKPRVRQEHLTLEEGPRVRPHYGATARPIPQEGESPSGFRAMLMYQVGTSERQYRVRSIYSLRQKRWYAFDAETYVEEVRRPARSSWRALRSGPLSDALIAHARATLAAYPLPETS